MRLQEDNAEVDYTAEFENDDETPRAATGRALKGGSPIWTRRGRSQGPKGAGDILYKEKKVDPWWTATLAVEYENARGAKEKDGLPRGYSICVTKPWRQRRPPSTRSSPTRWWLGGKCQLEEGRFDDGDGHAGVQEARSRQDAAVHLEGKRHQPGEVVEIKFTPSGAKTSVVLTHDRLPDRAAAEDAGSVGQSPGQAGRNDCRDRTGAGRTGWPGADRSVSW
jgi:hypothetical protein